jgi:hypothetical protein
MVLEKGSLVLGDLFRKTFVSGCIMGGRSKSGKSPGFLLSQIFSLFQASHPPLFQPSNGS